MIYLFFIAILIIIITYNRKKLKHNNIYIIDDFLSQDDCKRLLNLVDGNYQASSVVRFNGDKNFRNSATFFFKETTDIDFKIANILGVSLNNSEYCQIHHYKKDQQFKLHNDFFTYEDKKELNHGGQRTWTFIIFLNDVEDGGETYFPHFDKKIKPKQGRALFWNNLNSNHEPNEKMLHAGLPVINGNKYILTKFFRTKNYLFF